MKNPKNPKTSSWDSELSPLAECDQTSCRSVKEGYQMIHDQYLRGDFSLIINEADFSERNSYMSSEYSKQKYLEESLILDLPISEPVKVTFYRTGDTNPNPVNLCEVEGRKIQCDPSYEERVEFQASLQLKDLMDSDGGIYTIVDTKNKETVSTYKITVRGKT
ncbi:hypothetical protein AOLI_G00273920 [Acnodon oligacanthus]